MFVFSDTIVCPYQGTLIDAATAEQREEEHEELGLPAAIYKIKDNLMLDPYLVNGRAVTQVENPGRFLSTFKIIFHQSDVHQKFFFSFAHHITTELSKRFSLYQWYCWGESHTEQVPWQYLWEGTKR